MGYNVLVLFEQHVVFFKEFFIPKVRLRIVVLVI